MALAALSEYDDALMEYKTAAAILQKTVDARLVRNQIEDTTKSWIAFKEKMKNYLHKGTFLIMTSYGDKRPVGSLSHQQRTCT